VQFYFKQFLLNLMLFNTNIQPNLNRVRGLSPVNSKRTELIVELHNTNPQISVPFSFVALYSLLVLTGS